MTPASEVRRSENNERRSLAVLGSTGSIGTQTLEIVRLFPERVRVDTLVARGNIKLLAEQAAEFHPRKIIVRDEASVAELRRNVSDNIEVAGGDGAIREAARSQEVDVVVAAIVGFAGLEPVLSAISAGKTITLANKETLVVAGALIEQMMRANPDASLIPVDSEHSAIFQCLVGEQKESVEQLILTASGGPFRTRAQETFPDIRPHEALDHPNWTMGDKITIDSATMMNKGLEVIEARWLFGLSVDQISVVVHPQSIIHSMVTFRDGSVKAQLGVPDMKIPIQYALSYPDRWPAPHKRIDWSQTSCLDFQEPDFAKFPCLGLAYDALKAGGTAPAVLNAANEEAVSLFLSEKISFTEIPYCIEKALEVLSDGVNPSLESLAEKDRTTRRFVQELRKSRFDRRRHLPTS